MADFDFHRRRLGVRLRLVGSDPTVSRALLKRWAAAAGPRALVGPDSLRLPLVPLADLTGFDVEVRVEQEGGAAGGPDALDACVLVVGSGAGCQQDLRLLQRRARDIGNTGPSLWAAEQGWNETLAAAARKLGVEDDVLRDEVSSRRGALGCLEVALACLVDHALLRIHPAAPGEGAPDAAAIAERIRTWTRTVCPPAQGEGDAASPDTAPADPAEAQSARTWSGAASPDEPWRRRALELEKIEPLAEADAVHEIHALDLILKFSPPLPSLAGESRDRQSLMPTSAKGSRRR